MATGSISETKRIRYLLGQSSLAEREQIESLYFEDEDAFQEMLTAEDDLIGAYVRGELGDEEQRRFEKSFVSSLAGRDRVQFARAFESIVSAHHSDETKLPATLLDVSKTLQSPRVLRTATIATLIVFVAVLAWLVIDRGKMTDELRELRTESTELQKRMDVLQQSNASEPTQTAEIVTEPAALRPQPYKPRHREPRTTVTQPTRHLPEVKNDLEKFAIKPEPEERLINTADSAIGTAFASKQITELPLNARNVANLLSLQPGVTRSGYVAGSREDQSNITLEGVDVTPLNTYFLASRNTSDGDETIVSIPSSLSWIRFEIALEPSAIHENYRLIIETADARRVTSIDWAEPLTPDQTTIYTPVISTDDLPSGDYVLILMGKEPDSSFVKVAECPFKLIKY